MTNDDITTISHGPRPTVRQHLHDRKKLQTLSGLQRIGHCEGVVVVRVDADLVLEFLLLLDEQISQRNWLLSRQYPLTPLTETAIWPASFGTARLEAMRHAFRTSIQKGEVKS